MSESESTASGASTDDKQDSNRPIYIKPVTSVAGNSNALAHYEQSRGYDQISQSCIIRQLLHNQCYHSAVKVSSVA